MRVIHNHATVVDTTKALHVWEHDKYPQYYIPADELKNCSTKDTQQIVGDDNSGAAIVELTVPGNDGLEPVTTNRVIRFANEKQNNDLAGLVRLEFKSMGTALTLINSF